MFSFSCTVKPECGTNQNEAKIEPNKNLSNQKFGLITLKFLAKRKKISSCFEMFLSLKQREIQT